MRICLFYHSVVSDWNNGNAHFLRGLISSLAARGHEVIAFEPKGGWSLKNMLADKGRSAFEDFRKVFPAHYPVFYSEKNFNPADHLENADLVIVHEWNDPGVVKKIGEFRASRKNMVLLFHDTHHRTVTAPDEMDKFDLTHYDGVLAFGDVIRRIYVRKGWSKRAWTWHEAADDRIFHPVMSEEKKGDLVWIGNWGDDERNDELQEFIIEPVMELGLKACFYGVRYPRSAIKMLKKAKIKYKGWLPNYKVPEIFGRYNVTVHVPRRPYVNKLPGVPTIRMFEALACGIPLITSPWDDSEKLFSPGKDYLVAHNGEEMKKQLAAVLTDRELAQSLSAHGLETIRSRHTCDHRVDQLLLYVSEIKIWNREKAFSNSIFI